MSQVCTRSLLSRRAGASPRQAHFSLEKTAIIGAHAAAGHGFLTSVHDTADTLDGGRYYVPFFNPASNTRQVSSLRLVNNADVGYLPE